MCLPNAICYLLLKTENVWTLGLAHFQKYKIPSIQNGLIASALATYLIPGCVGRGVRLGSEGSSVGGGGGVDGGGVWKFGVQKMEKLKTLKIQIHFAQNVGKVWKSREKILPTLFGAI